ncbi:site-2 protease family protein [Candidatus Woesearchaeota archaeon]|nr:site-2 protease family protein [Candidatus Woesearchaeota archaeon]
MIDFQTIAAIVFLIVLTILVFLKRKNLDTKQIIPYFLYFSMYRTKFGLGLMDKLSKKCGRFIVYAGYAGVFAGFAGMAFIGFMLAASLVDIFVKPEAAQGVGLVLPFKAKGVFFVPFFYWIISIFVIAVVHEFAHGLIARAHNLRVKSSGFAFLGIAIPIIPAAFVEPDEKELRKRSHKEQLSVFAAGPFSNIIAAFLCLAILSFLIAPLANAAIEPNGVKITDYVRGKGNEKFPAENAGMKIGEVIQSVDGNPTPYVGNLSSALRGKKPNDAALIKTDRSSYEIKLARNPDNGSLAYIGAYLEQSTRIKDDVRKNYGLLLPNALVWVTGLFVFLYILNLGIGLFNLVPIGPLDGGRMLQLVLQKFFDKEKSSRIFYYTGMFFLAVILANIVAGFVK